VPHSCTWGARETVRDGTTRILPQAEVCCDVSYSRFVPCFTSTGESATTVFALSSSFSPSVPMLFAFATSAVDRVLCLVPLEVDDGLVGVVPLVPWPVATADIPACATLMQCGILSEST